MPFVTNLLAERKEYPKFSKTKAEFYKNLLVRTLIIGLVGTLLFLTKTETLLELKNRDFPEYVEAKKKLMQAPLNTELERIANEEQKKKHIEMNKKHICQRCV